MALLDCEGFGLSNNPNDYATYGVYSGQFNSSGIAATPAGAPTYGDPALDVGINANYLRNLPSPVSTLFYGVRCSPYYDGESKYSFNTGWRFNDSAGNQQLSVVADNISGALRVLSASGATLGQTADAVFPASLPENSFFYLEIGIVVGTGTNGSVILKVNGTVVLTLTGITTQATALANIGQTQIYVAYNSSGGRMQVMHQYWCDATGAAPNNTFLGDTRIQVLRPTSNDAVAFTPVGNASNWQNAAAEPPAPSTNYNTSSTTGAQDTFNCGAMATGLGTVYGVASKAVMASSAAGRSAQTALKSGTSVVLGTSTPVPPGGVALGTIAQLDPNTSAAWTMAGVNAVKPGYKISV